MLSALAAQAFAVFAAISPDYPRMHSAPEVARAIATVILEDGPNAPVYSSHNEDLTMAALFAVRESSLDPSAVGDGGHAHGIWQLHGACGKASIEQQARCWLRMLRASKCEHPIAALWGQCTGRVPYGFHRTADVEILAAGREARARELMWLALAATEHPNQ